MTAAKRLLRISISIFASNFADSGGTQPLLMPVPRDGLYAPPVEIGQCGHNSYLVFGLKSR